MSTTQIMRKWSHVLECGDGTLQRISAVHTLEEAAEMLRLRSRMEDRGYKTPCRVWIGSKVGGCGNLRFCGNPVKILKTHRISWQINFGTIPDGKEVCHFCDQPDCFEPTHLFLGTHFENMSDAKNKGRFNPTKGEACHAARFNSETVLALRVIFKTRPPTAEMAKRFGVSYTALKKIERRVSWKHI